MLTILGASSALRNFGAGDGPGLPTLAAVPDEETSWLLRFKLRTSVAESSRASKDLMPGANLAPPVVAAT